MERRVLGATGIVVSALGYGAGNLGLLCQGEADRLLSEALDLGITFFDTARSYGSSEERLGRFARARRRDLVVSTKVGYGVDGVPDWTGECVRRGVDAALARMGLDVLDVVFLHSCGAEVLARGEVVDALDEAKRAGKIRATAYSGDGAALRYAVESARFDCVQCSLNPVDQDALGVIEPAGSTGLGVIAKRTLANAPWRYAAEPARADEAEYWRRSRALAFPLDEERALRFVLALPVASALVGTTSPEHLRRNVEIASRGPLAHEETARMRAAFGGWPGLV